MTAQKSSRVLVLTNDVLGQKMAGPAIRTLEMARVLHAANIDVQLVSTQASTLEEQNFPVSVAHGTDLEALVDWADVLVAQGNTLMDFPWMSERDVIIVADIYDPMHLEAMELGRGHTQEERMDQVLRSTESLNLQIERADFMLCASEKQRDLWLGHLGALARLNVYTYDADPSLRNLIDIAPFGVPENPPVQTRHAIRGTVPGICADDEVIIWGGGVYNWFDPLTLIHAIAHLRSSRPKLRLYFLGMGHPNPQVPAMRMAADAIQLSDELGLTGTHVFFNSEWVEYEDRVNYLLDADLGVSTHFDHIETAFSFRTRILDYLWTGLPVVATDGDVFASIIRENDFGIVVPPEDPLALSAALDSALEGKSRDAMSANSRNFASQLTWEQNLAPLVAFCQEPHHAADFGDLAVSLRNQKLSAVTAHAESLQERANHLAAELTAIQSSTSWKLTRPLRSVLGRLRGGHNSND